MFELEIISHRSYYYVTRNLTPASPHCLYSLNGLLTVNLCRRIAETQHQFIKDQSESEKVENERKRGKKYRGEYKVRRGESD